MKENVRIQMLRIGTLLLGSGSVCYGLIRGEHMDVLAKAVKVCLECIGIG